MMACKHAVFWTLWCLTPVWIECATPNENTFFRREGLNAGLRHDLSVFSNISRLRCASKCQEMGSFGFLYGKDKRCQTFYPKDTEKGFPNGTYELWKAAFNHLEPVEFLIAISKKLYWYKYKLEYSELVSEIALPEQADPQTAFAYNKTTHLCYWLYTGKGIYSGNLTEKKIEKYWLYDASSYIFNFRIDFNSGKYFYFNPDLSWSTVEEGTIHTLFKGSNGNRVFAGSLDTVEEMVYFMCRMGIYRVHYDGSQLELLEKKEECSSIHFNMAESTLIWGTKFGVLKCRKMEPNQRRIRVLAEDLSYVDSIVSHNQLIFYKAFSDRGVKVITLDGIHLPSFAEDKVDFKYEILLTKV